MPVTVVEDGDTFTVDASLEDRASDSPSAPATIEYHIDDVTDPSTPVLVQDWTTVETGDTVSIAIASLCNAILTASNPFEIKQITITADRGEAFQCSIQATWKVVNQNLA
jgi:hypothetical protein